MDRSHRFASVAELAHALAPFASTDSNTAVKRIEMAAATGPGVSVSGVRTTDPSRSAATVVVGARRASRFGRTLIVAALALAAVGAVLIGISLRKRDRALAKVPVPVETPSMSAAPSSVTDVAPVDSTSAGATDSAAPQPTASGPAATTKAPARPPRRGHTPVPAGTSRSDPRSNFGERQ